RSWSRCRSASGSRWRSRSIGRGGSTPSCAARCSAPTWCRGRRWRCCGRGCLPRGAAEHTSELQSPPQLPCPPLLQHQNPHHPRLSGAFRSRRGALPAVHSFPTRRSSDLAIVVTLSLSLGLALAVALDRPGRLYAFVRGAVFSAYVVSWVAVALLWTWLLDASGPLFVLWHGKQSGLKGWLADPDTALAALAMVSVWKITGYAMVIFLARLQDIPNSVHEPAALDGAGSFRRFVYITFPLLRPTLAFVATTSLILSFQAFDVVRVMTQGGPVHSTTVFVYAIYEAIFMNLRVGRASA